MTQDSSTDTSDASSDMNATIASYSRSLEASGPAPIPEEHLPYAAAILAIDPSDVRGDVSLDSINPNFKPKLTALSPDLQSEAQALMDRNGLDEGEAVERAVKQHLNKNRASIGSSPDTNDYHRELVSIASEVQDIERKKAGLWEMIDRVVDVRLDRDEKGEPVAVPVYGYSKSSRERMQKEVERLDYAKSLLVKSDGSLGYEGKKRADTALASAAAKIAKVADAQKLRKEAEQRAAEIVRDEARERLAQQIASNKRRSL